MNKNKIIILSAVAYITIGIITFGHVAASWDNARCGTFIERKCDSVNKSAAGIVGGLLWPFYWSWELQGE